MYPGFSVSNILEAAQPKSHNILYQPHYSVYDLCMLNMDVSLHCVDPNVNKFFDKDSGLILDNDNTLTLRAYSIYVTNNPMLSLRNNIAGNIHLNSVFISHDQNLLHMKKEDRFLLCQNAIKPNDALYYYLPNMRHFSCSKIHTELTKYCIPEILVADNHSNNLNSIALCCYNKELPSNYLTQITNSNINVTNLTTIPKNIEDAHNIYQQYHAVVEVDSGSIINILWAIKSGCVGIIMDNNNILESYKDIPNLYIVHSLSELSEILNNLPSYRLTEWPEHMFISLESFKSNMLSIFTKTSNKAYLL